MRLRSAAIALLLALALGVGAVTAYRKQGFSQQAQAARQLLQKRREAWDGLKASISREIQDFPGETGVVIEDLETGWRFVHQEGKEFPAASVVKIPMMTACYQAVRERRLDLTSPVTLRGADKVLGSGVLKGMPNGSVVSTWQLVGWMVTQSDNTATNLLIDRLGMDYFNRSFGRLGLRGTRLSRKMMDFSSRARGIENYTTAEDVAAVLQKLYRSTLGDRAASAASLELLKHQKLKDRIPALLPPEVVVAHKTGLERYVCHDAGIVYTENGDYLISVLTQRIGKGGSQLAKKFIARLARHVYQYEMERPTAKSPSTAQNRQG